MLERFPERPQALALRAASAWLRGDTQTYEQLELDALMADPRSARFYWTVGEHAVRHFRYVDAVGLFEQAIALDAGFAPALISLGIAYSRVGDDERALRFLQRAFDADPFHVEAFNMANLWEQMLMEYRFVDDAEVEGLRYRFHREEAEVLERYVPDAMRAAWQTYVERYGFTPETPVSIEVFRDQSTFSVRSIGLPHAGQQGICFGQVVTSRSPSEGSFNWHQVMAHELSHVFSLQRSNYRVPRWFTEGLAEYDTMLSRPEWYREQDLALVRALQRDRLLSVNELDRAFTDVERFEQVLEAYYQAALTVEFIGNTWGYDALLSMLECTPTRIAALTEALGLGVEAFDARFAEHLRQRYAASPARGAGGLARAADGAGADRRGRAGLGRGAHGARAIARGRGRLEDARRGLDAALALDPRHADALTLRGIAAARGEGAAARAREALFGQATGTSPPACTRGRSRRSAAEKRPHGPLRRRARRLPALRGGRAGALETQTRLNRDRRLTLATLVRLDQHDAASRVRSRERLEAGDLSGAFAAARQASDVAPFDGRVRAVFGRAAFAMGEWSLARREIEGALELGAGERDDLLTMLLRVYSELGQHDDVTRVRNLLSP